MERCWNSRMKALNLLLILAMLAGMASAVGASSEQASSGISKLVIGTTESMTNIEMSLNNYVLKNYLMMFTNEGFIEYDENGSVLPRLAAEWETSDSKQWTVHLVPNASWHDGVPFTSKDVKFTIEYMKENMIPFGESAWDLVSSIETPDDHTVVINLNNPDSGLFGRRSVIPFTIPEHIFKDVDSPKDLNDPAKLFTGTGPYVFDSYDQSAGIIRFKANEDYWGGKPAVDELEIKFYKNHDTLMMAFQKGDVDVPFIYAEGVSYYYVPKLLQNSEIEVMSYDSRGIKNVLYFNCDRPPFNDKRFREAISYALDYDELVNLMTAGYGYTPNAGMVLKGMPYYIETRRLSQDINRSKNMLDSIGFKDIDGDGFREADDGKQFHPELLIINDMESSRSSELINNYLHEIGIDSRIKAVDEATFWQIVEDEKSYDMNLCGAGFWTTFNYRGYYTSVVDYRRFGWANVHDPVYLSLVDQIGSAPDEQPKENLIKDLQNYYADNLTQIPLYAMDYIQPYNKKYEGYVPNPVWGIMSRETFMGLHEAE
jgi:peptide/nickel transport system substrate-binding protein